MINIQVRSGTIAEVVALSRQIPEFNHPYGEAEYQSRLAEVEHLIQIAEVEGEMAGFYVSYAKSEQECYLWMSGMLPDFRGLGLASTLLQQLQQWAQQRGYRELTVKSRNRYANKVRLLLKNGFHIVDFEAKGDDSADHRLYFRKAL